MSAKTWNRTPLICLVLLAFQGCSGGSLDLTVAAQESKQGKNAEMDENPFPGRSPAPSLEGGVEWLNTSGEITLKDLRGKIVLLDFWTFCCINCIHVLPDLKFLEEKYSKELVVIGVHAAKFDNEKDTENIRRAILRYEISHPVINDANMTVARKYNFNSWPTLVVVDPEGNYVGYLSGEGNREVLDEVISKMAAFHRKKGTLDETPVSFILERQRSPSTPLRFPGKLLADTEKNRLFISDSNHNRIIITDLEGKLLDVIGNGQIGLKDGEFSQAQFDHPQGMTLVGETLYVADTENHSIRTVDLAAKTVKTLAGTGEQARRRVPGGKLLKTALNSPWDLVHLNGVLYIAMAGPHQLWHHKLGTDQIEVYAGSGREDIIDGPPEDAALAQPSGLTTDGKYIYWADSEGSSVRKMLAGSTPGEVVTIAGAHDLPLGRSLFEFGDEEGVGPDARFQHPLGVLHHEGKLYVADSYNHRIKVVEIESRKAERFLGTGKRGTGLEPLELSEPAGLTLAGDSLIIADTNNHRLVKVDLKTRKASEFTIEGLTPPPPPKIQEVAETDHVTPLPEHSIKPGQELTLQVGLKLPEGYKLNPEALPTYKLKQSEAGGVVASEQIGSRMEAALSGDKIVIKIPTSSDARGGKLEISLSYSYCRDGVGGLCKFGTARWQLPITIDNKAASEPLQLEATADGG